MLTFSYLFVCLVFEPEFFHALLQSGFGALVEHELERPLCSILHCIATVTFEPSLEGINLENTIALHPIEIIIMEFERHNHRGSPRKCNKYHSREYVEGTEAFDIEELVIGSSAKRTKGVRSEPGTPTKAKGQPDYKIIKRGSAAKKSDRHKYKDAATDAGGGQGGSAGGYRDSRGDRRETGLPGRGPPPGRGGPPAGRESAPAASGSRGDGGKHWFKPPTKVRGDFGRGQIWSVPYHV